MMDMCPMQVTRFAARGNMVNTVWRAVLAMVALLSAGVARDVGAAERVTVVAQASSRPFDSRPPTGAPTPAPRSSAGDTMVLPRVPYNDRLDGLSRRGPDGRSDRRPRPGPESQRVVPKAPGAGGDPATFFDKPAGNALSCENLRRLAERTGRLYWRNRYDRCIGTK